MGSPDENNDEKKNELMPFWGSGFGDLDKVFDDFKKMLSPSFETRSTFPKMFESSLACNLIDEGDRFVITADMPRVKKEEVNLNVGDDYIEISAEHKESEKEKKRKFIRKEQSEISIHRKMSLPERVKSSDVKAKLEQGILTVNLPKEEPTPKPKSTKIEID